MPRILAYVHAYPGPMNHQAGGETSLHDALRHLKGRGWDVAVLIGETTTVRDYVIDDIPVYTCLNQSDVKSLPFNFFPNADIVFTQLACAQRANVLARMFKKPLLHMAHNNHPYTMKQANQADVVLFNTEWVKKDFRDSGYYTPGQILHPAVDPDRYRVKRNRGSKYITLINLSKGDDGLYDKGWQTFFELARRNPDLPFLGVRGAYGNQAYEDLPNVTYMDHMQDITPVYQKTKVLLVPSKYESFGRVAVEAAASGIPSICTPTQGLIEAMGDSAHYSTYGDYDSWNEDLYDVLGNHEYFASHAKERSKFLWEQSQQELEDFALGMEIIHSEGLRTYYDFLEV